MEGLPQIATYPSLDAHRMPTVQKHLGSVARCEMDATPYRIRSSHCPNIRVPVWRFQALL
jgi:hypothetical protein